MYKTNPKSEQIYTFPSKLHYNSLIKRRLYKAHKNQPQRCEKISHHFAHSNRNPSQKLPLSQLDAVQSHSEAIFETSHFHNKTNLKTPKSQLSVWTLQKVPCICLHILTYILNQTQTIYLERLDVQDQPKVITNIHIFIKITLQFPYKKKAI